MVRKNENTCTCSSSFRCRFEQGVGASVSRVRGCYMYHDLHHLPVESTVSVAVQYTPNLLDSTGSESFK